MLRKLTLLACLCFGLLQPVFAAGLGEIVVRSTLNQRFSATIPLINVTPVEAEGLRVRLASKEEFERVGIERLEYLSSLKFQVNTQGNSSYISISSSQVAQEPFLNFLIDVRPAGGTRIQREYIVLLDPPGLAQAQLPAEPAAAAAPARLTPPTAAAAKPSTSVGAGSAAAAAIVDEGGDSGRRYGPVRNGESFWSIASKLRPPSPATLDQSMLAIFEINPRAFPNGVDSLRKGSTLKVPTPERVVAVGPAAAKARLRELRGLPPDPDAPEAEPAVMPAAGEAAATRVSLTEPLAAANLPAPQPAETPAEADAAAPVPGDTAVPSGPEAAPADAPSQAGLPETEAAEAAATARTEELAADEAAPPAVKEQPAKPKLTFKLPVIDWNFEPLEDLPREPMLVALALLLLWLLIRVIRHRRENERTTIPPMQRMIHSSAVVAAAGRQTGNGFAVPASGPIALTATESLRLLSAEPPPESEPPTLGTRVEPTVGGVPPEPATPADPLVEAELNLAHGRYAEAAALLIKASEQEPGRLDLRVKLAQTYFAASKAEEFWETTEPLKEQLSAPEWEKLAVLGRKLLPGVVLFAEAEAKPKEPIELPKVVEPEVVPEPAPEPAPEVPIETTAPPASDAPNVLDFPPEALEPVTPLPATPSPPPPPAAKPEDRGNLLELDLGDFDLDSTAKPVLPAQDDDRFGDLKFEDFKFDLDDLPAEEQAISHGDEAGTKLDLARVYADMGDNEMARSLLGEVIEGGSPTQRQEAQTLLSRLTG